MDQRFERVRDPNGKSTISGLYRREYCTATGEASCRYYGRLKRRSDGKRIVFALGGNLTEAKDQWAMIRIKNRRGESLDDFKPERKAKADTSERPMTFSEWAQRYPLQEGIKDKRSLSADMGMIRLHLEPFFGAKTLTEIERKDLNAYINKRSTEFTVRAGNPSKKLVARGTVSNELSLLRHMLNVAKRELESNDKNKIAVTVPNFDELIKRVNHGGRSLDADERKKVLAEYPKWLARLSEFAAETAISEGDILRLTDAMIDRENRVVVPDGGRMKTQHNDGEDNHVQISPLTDHALQILDEIQDERSSGKVVSIDRDRLIFTREDGRRITRDMISRGVKRAWKKAEVKKFVFHNYRNTALTNWSEKGIPVDIAMQASGHTSVQMHKRYVALRRTHISSAFGLLEMVNTNGKQEHSDEKATASK